MLYVKSVVVAMHVDSCNFHFVSGPGNINLVSQEDDLFLSGNSSWRNRTRRLLQGDFLEIAVDYLVQIELEWACGLAVYTSSWSHVFVVLKKERAFFVSTLRTNEQNLLHL